MENIKLARRFDDSTMGRAVHMFPVIMGITMVLISIGGYIATIKFMGDKVNAMETRQTRGEEATLAGNVILSRVTAIQDTMDRRITRLEDVADGVLRRPTHR